LHAPEKKKLKHMSLILSIFNSSQCFLKRVAVIYMGTIIVTGLFIFGLSLNSHAQGPGVAWPYSRTINLSPVTPSANYQVKIILSATVLGNPYSNIKTDGSDLRFYDNSNVNCDYWIESWNNAGTSTIWAKVATAGSSSLLMYYGNSSAMATTSGANTFPFFDDFEGSGLGINWSANPSGGSISVAGGQVTLSNSNGGSVYISSAFTPSSNSFLLETKHKEPAYNRNRFYASSTLGGFSPTGYDYGFFTNATPQIFWNGWTGVAVSINTDYITRWQIADGSTYNWYNITYSTGAIFDTRNTTVTATIRYITIMVTEAAGTSIIVDWVRVRKYASSEPVATVSRVPTFIATLTHTTCPGSTNGAIILNNLPSAVEFLNSDNDYIDLGNTFMSGRSAFTLEGWLKFNKSNITTNRVGLFGQNDVIEFGIIDPNNLMCWTPNGGSLTVAISLYPGDNAWHHIAVVGNGTNILMYIDGALVGTGGSSTSNYGTGTTYTAKIGGDVFDASGGSFTGQIMKVGFYSTALTATRIGQLASGFAPYTGSETGLLAAYNFFEGTGTTLSRLPAGTNGTFQNSPVWIEPFTYVWTKTGDAGFNRTTKNISSLSTGQYNVTVSLGTGSVSNSSTINYLNPLPAFTVAYTDITCFNANNGTITVTVISGTSPYQYSKDAGSNWQSSNQFSSLGPGNYFIVVKDSYCVQTNCTIIP
jgi:hypothetical protein